MQFVSSLRSRFLRRTRSTRVWGAVEEEDITSQPEGSMFFEDAESKTIMVAAPILPRSVTPAYALALAVTQILTVGTYVLALRLGWRDRVVSEHGGLMCGDWNHTQGQLHSARA